MLARSSADGSPWQQQLTGSAEARPRRNLALRRRGRQFSVASIAENAAEPGTM
jgi:hypothetical protein